VLAFCTVPMARIRVTLTVIVAVGSVPLEFRTILALIFCSVLPPSPLPPTPLRLFMHHSVTLIPPLH